MTVYFSVPASQWNVGDVASLIRTFEFLAAKPELSRRHRGTVAVTFAEVEEESAYVATGVLSYLRRVFAAFPTALYYLSPDPNDASFWSWLCAHSAIPPSLVDGRVMLVPTDELWMEAKEMLTDVAIFAVEMGDDWVEAVRGHLGLLDDLKSGTWPRAGMVLVDIRTSVMQHADCTIK